MGNTNPIYIWRRAALELRPILRRCACLPPDLKRLLARIDAKYGAPPPDNLCHRCMEGVLEATGRQLDMFGKGAIILTCSVCKRQEAR